MLEIKLAKIVDIYRMSTQLLEAMESLHQLCEGCDTDHPMTYIPLPSEEMDNMLMLLRDAQEVSESILRNGTVKIA